VGDGNEAGAKLAPVDESALAREGMSLAVTVAKRTARRLGGHVPVDDLISLGGYALVGICRTWDPTRATFAAYATRRLGWAMLDGIRKETHGRWAAARATALIGSERLSEAYGAAAPAAEHAGPTTAEQDGSALRSMLSGHAAALAIGLMAADPDAQLSETPEEKFAQLETAHVARAAVGALPERERALLERHYFGGEAFEAIARDLNITKSWASRLHQRGLLAVAAALGAEGEIRDDASVDR
jgi:RNA polymerase sigma factor FliA